MALGAALNADAVIDLNARATYRVLDRPYVFSIHSANLTSSVPL